VVIILLISSALPFINRLTHRPSIDLAVSGALNGKMTQLSRYRDSDTGCSTRMVQGQREWVGGFTGVVGSDHLLFLIAVYPYPGPGKYEDPAVLDTRTLYQGTRIRPRRDTPVHVLLSTIPPSAPDATEYGTDPNPVYAPTSQANAGHQPPVGQVSLTLNPDQKSGRITAVLMNARAIAGTPVTVSGTFKCGTLDSR
jgi:hypothetical protein